MRSASRWVVSAVHSLGETGLSYWPVPSVPGRSVCDSGRMYSSGKMSVRPSTSVTAHTNSKCPTLPSAFVGTTPSTSNSSRRSASASHVRYQVLRSSKTGVRIAAIRSWPASG